MNAEIKLRKEAESDLEEASTWYEGQALNLGQQFLDEVTATLLRIRENPRLYPVVYRQVRRAVIHKFPFAIFYLIKNESLLVIAIIHASRAPSNWKQRI